MLFILAETSKKPSILFPPGMLLQAFHEFCSSFLLSVGVFLIQHAQRTPTVQTFHEALVYFFENVQIKTRSHPSVPLKVSDIHYRRIQTSQT